MSRLLFRRLFLYGRKPCIRFPDGTGRNFAALFFSLCVQGFLYKAGLLHYT